MSKSIKFKNDYYLDGASIWQHRGETVINGTKKLQLNGDMFLLALYNDWGNFGFYILNKNLYRDNKPCFIISTLRESTLIEITSDNGNEITIKGSQIKCHIYLMKIR